MMGFLKRADWLLNGSVIFLATAGFLMLLSSSPDIFVKQIIFFGVGFVFLIIAPLFDLRHLVNYRWLMLSLLALSVILLVSVHFLGIEVSGSRSWLDFGAFRLQPSEFTKAALIIVLSAFFSKRHIAIRRPIIILGSFAYFIIPVTLILMEPDLGSALILFGIWFGYLLVAGLPWKYIVTGAALFAVIVLIAWNVGFKDYQKDRILAVFNPEADPLGVSYNVMQSKNAIGSAGIFGKGFGQGEIVRLEFLPAAQTDFAFASFTEEWGILGGMLVIAAFALLIWRISIIGLAAKDNFSKFICLGTMLFFGLQFVVNMGSVVGLTPVIGIALPFLSAGGSNLAVAMFLLGVVQNIASRKKA